MKGSNIQMIIQFNNRQTKYQTAPIKAVIRHTLQKAEQMILLNTKYEMPWLLDVKAEPQISITLTGPRIMRRINRETSGVDSTTDVLSFPLIHMYDGRVKQLIGPADYEQGRQLAMPLGDLLICLDQASRQSHAYGHSFEREIAFLTLHGFLHLIGFDHDRTEREQTMRQLQRDVLDAINLDRSGFQEGDKS